jgi:hypothetical protein
MKDKYIQMSHILLEFIEQLTDVEYQLLLEGRGMLAFYEIEDHFVAEESHEPEDVIETFQTKEALETFLLNFKKTELTKIAEGFEIRVLKNDTKKKIIQNITDLLIGAKERRDLFKRIQMDYHD